jgi:hypothetical protein
MRQKSVPVNDCPFDCANPSGIAASLALRTRGVAASRTLPAAGKCAPRYQLRTQRLFGFGPSIKREF